MSEQLLNTRGGRGNYNTLDYPDGAFGDKSQVSSSNSKRRLFKVIGITVAVLMIVAIVAALAWYFTSDKKNDNTPAGLDNIRLPNYVIPTNYTLTQQIDIDNDAFNGTVVIDMTVKNSVNTIWLHAVNLTILSAPTLWIAERNATWAATDFYLYTTSKTGDSVGFLVITFSDALPIAVAGEANVVLSISFAGYLHADLFGLYRSSYTDSSNNLHKLATTHMEPTSARWAFPCFDEPALKASWTVSIVSQASYPLVLANMPAVRETQLENGWKRTDFQTSPAISSYLIAFVVCDFHGWSLISPTFNTNITTWAPAEWMNAAPTPTNTGVLTMDWFNSVFTNNKANLNVQYPLPKLDQIAIPDFAAGAMENIGLVTYRTTALLYNNVSNSDTEWQSSTSTIAHENAHQWTGNLVTCAWWYDIWLNEGFATFLTALSLDSIFPAWDLMNQAPSEILAAAFTADASPASHAIVNTAVTPQQIRSAFDSITYSKGGAILRMMYFSMNQGQDYGQGWIDTMREYLDTYRFSVATTEQFLAVAAKHSNIPEYATVMHNWLYEPGFPLLSVSLDTNTRIWKISQQRFYSQIPTTIDSTTWSFWLNYSLVDANGLSYRGVMITSTDNLLQAPGNTSVPIPLLHLNSRATTFCRVRYSLPFYNEFINLINTSTVTYLPEDRAQLIDDAFALVYAGYSTVEDPNTPLPWAVPLNLTTILINETFFPVWRVALSRFDALFDLVRSQDTAELSKYFSYLVSPLLNSLPFAPTDNHVYNMLQSRILSSASRFGLEKAKEITLAAYTRFNSTGVLPWPDIQSVVFQQGVLSDGVDGNSQFDFLLNLLPTANFSSINRLYFALASSQNPNNLGILLNRCLNGQVRSQDVITVFTYTYGNKPVGEDVLWTFLQSEWSKLSHMFDGFEFGRFLQRFVATVSDPTRLQQIQDFFASTEFATAVAVGAAQANANINFLAGPWSNSVLPWLTDFNSAH